MGAVTLSITTLCIMTLCIMNGGMNVALNVIIPNVVMLTVTCHDTQHNDT
jgi:hypothetical protein